MRSKASKFRAIDTFIEFRTNDEYLENFMRSLYPKRIIPDFFEIEKNEKDNSKTEDTAIISYYIDQNMSKVKEKIKKRGGKWGITVYSPAYSPGEVSFLILQLLERIWEEDYGRYIIEASAIGDNNKGVIFVGPSGSGKSLMALEMFKRGYEFISNENTVISENDQIVGGTKVANFKEFILQLFPEVKKYAKESYSVSNVRRYLVEFPSSESRKELDLKAIIKIRALMDSNFFEVRELDYEELGFLLYDFPTKLIRGVLTPLGKYTTIAENLDTKELASKRMRKFFNLKIPAYSLYGNYKKIGDWIENVL